MEKSCIHIALLASIWVRFKMNDELHDNDLQFEIGRQNFVRAAQKAALLGLSVDKIRELQLEAIWRMAAINRNAPGVKHLAQEYGFKKEYLKKYLDDRANREINNGNIKALSTCFDITTGKYFDFKEWLDFYTGKWKD